MKIFPAGVHVKMGVAGLAGRSRAQFFMVVDLVAANFAGQNGCYPATIYSTRVCFIDTIELSY